MSDNEVGVDPNEAHGAGRNTIEISENFKGISKRFFDACEDALDNSGKGKLKLKGFDEFGQDGKEKMTEIQDHGTQMGGNMSAGADSAVRTDEENQFAIEEHGYR
ncbi:hypothetical protein [Halostreptopolyspora alba]|uniref:Uncharacterized protein n=1 Tax=Halostreptopolyspora alba TaxID=2487137 RepID=A0A3N0ECH4_9ACTN|nr:hypothetical protein EFW17_08700 [Nocardiopsaceae bacterium YIM 96095]